jgi:hypothetical protein
MVNSKTAHAMLSKSPQLPPKSKPIQILAISNSQNSLSCLGHSILYVRIILDLLAEVIIIYDLSHWISTQGISIRMPHTWSVHNLEAEVL